MLTDRQAWSLRRDGIELTADIRGCVWLGVKTVVLCQATGEKDKDYGLHLLASGPAVC